MTTKPKRRSRAEAAANLRAGRAAAKAAKAVSRRMNKPNGRSCKDKGSRFEREVVAAFLAGGIFAERVPLSGAAGGSFGADVDVTLPNRGIKKFECKSRARAWQDLYNYLRDNFALVIKRDNAKPLVVLPLKTFVELHGEQW